MPAGEAGELVARPRLPFAITPGYYGFPAETARAFRNLWFHTGDRVRRDEDGYVYFIDRLSDSIRRRGENISSFEVERAANAHSEVRDSAAVGVPSEVGEEEVKLYYVPGSGAHLDPAELHAHLECELPRFMVPRYLECLPELPRSATGKVRKGELRAAGEGGITSDTWDRDAR